MIFNEIVQYLTSKDLVSDKQMELFSSLSEIFIEFPIDNEPPSSAAVALSANCGAELPQAISCGLNCITFNPRLCCSARYFFFHLYKICL